MRKCGTNNAKTYGRISIKVGKYCQYSDNKKRKYFKNSGKTAKVKNRG